MAIADWNNKVLLGINVAQDAVELLKYEDNIEPGLWVSRPNTFVFSDYYPNTTGGNQKDFSRFDKLWVTGENYQKIDAYRDYITSHHVGFWLKIKPEYIFEPNTFLVIDYLWDYANEDLIWEWNENKQIFLPVLKTADSLAMTNVYGLYSNLDHIAGSNDGIYPYNNNDLPYVVGDATNRGSLIIDLNQYCNTNFLKNNCYIYINCAQQPNDEEPAVARLFVQQISVFQCVELPFSREISGVYTYSQNSVDNTSMSGITSQYILGWPEIAYNFSLKHNDLAINTKFEKMQLTAAMNGGIWWLKDKNKYFYIQTKQAPMVSQLANTAWEIQVNGSHKY